MKRIGFLLAFLFWALPAYAQVGQFYRANHTTLACGTDITAPVPAQTFCFDQSNLTNYVWTASGWSVLSSVTGASGIVPPAGDIGGTTSAPTILSTHLSAPLPKAQGGTGTASPGLVAGTNITITGSAWPNSTINSTGGGGTPGGSTGSAQYNNAGVFGGVNGTGVLKLNGASAPTVSAGNTLSSHNFANAITALGALTGAQPAFTDISGVATVGQLPAPGGDISGTYAAMVVNGQHYAATSIPNCSTPPTTNQFIQYNGTCLTGGNPTGSGTVASSSVGQVAMYTAATTVTGTTPAPVAGANASYTGSAWPNNTVNALPIHEHVLTESAGAFTLAVNNAVAPAIDDNTVVLNANALATTPNASQMVAGSYVHLRASEGGTPFTLGFVAGTGVTLLDLTTSGNNSAVGATCPVPTNGVADYWFWWDGTNLNLYDCNPWQNTCQGTVTLSGGSGSTSNGCITSTTHVLCIDQTAANPLSCTPGAGSLSAQTPGVSSSDVIFYYRLW